VFHPYSDRPEEGFQANCYAYDEAFAEKLRALGERTRPRDLYDVVNLYRHEDSLPSPSILRDVLEQKCAYKAIPVPTVASLAPHRADLEAMWQDMLGHQLPSLPSLVEFWDALPEIFTMCHERSGAGTQAHIQHAAGEIAIRSRILPKGVPQRGRSILEIIRFAAANHLWVDLTYDSGVRRIGPYSLRQTAEGNFVLHAIRSDLGEHRSYRVDRMQGASVTAQAFSPRYAVELTQTGPFPVSPTTSTPRIAKRPGASRSTGPVYMYRYVVCQKLFGRRSMNGSLNEHKNPRGYLSMPWPDRRLRPYEILKISEDDVIEHQSA
jgi:hypothetical protein